jgi:hypothetical protein
MKYSNKDEYDGMWSSDKKQGLGVFKEASTGRIEKRIYAKDRVRQVREVI